MLILARSETEIVATIQRPCGNYKDHSFKNMRDRFIIKARQVIKFIVSPSALKILSSSSEEMIQALHLSNQFFLIL